MTAMTNLCCNPCVNHGKIRYDAWDEIRRKKGRSNISNKRSKKLLSESKSKSHLLHNNNATIRNRSASVGHKREENRLKMINSNRFNPFTCPCAYPFEDKKTISIQERAEVIYYEDKLNDDLVAPKQAQTSRKNRSRSRSRSKSRSRSSSLNSMSSSSTSTRIKSILRTMSASRNRYDDKAPKTRLIRVG